MLLGLIGHHSKAIGETALVAGGRSTVSPGGVSEPCVRRSAALFRTALKDTTTLYTLLHTRRSEKMAHDLAAGPPEARVQQGQGKFENVISPVLLAHGCRVPYGLEVESRFVPRPAFAGGSDARKHLHVKGA